MTRLIGAKLALNIAKFAAASEFRIDEFRIDGRGRFVVS